MKREKNNKKQRYKECDQGRCRATSAAASTKDLDHLRVDAHVLEEKDGGLEECSEF